MKQLGVLLLTVILTGLTSCNSGPVTTHATGIAYEVIVVMDRAALESNAGEAIKQELTSPVAYLPQDEASLRTTYCPADQFDGMFKIVRNILIVNINRDLYTKVSMLPEKDKWARGQMVVKLNAPDATSLETYLAENKRTVVNLFTEEEMKRAAEFLTESYSPTVLEKVQAKFGISLYAPSDIKSSKEGENCLWFSNDAPTGRMDLLIYTFPFTDKNTFTLDYLVEMRDSVAKQMIPGAFEGSYMSTEKRVVDYSASKLHGKYCGIVRGLWRMEGGDMMGGPFVSYARVDEENKRVIVTEGFVYEPNKEKKNYIRRLEASLQTCLFPDELHGEVVVTHKAQAKVESAVE
ncbi:MAG: DUF4837 family protein [Tannerella sp.]|nr:DUF4837 family protein [Tannerella sp.]